jgi:pyridoxal phosphate enzyme (YggS family)
MFEALAEHLGEVRQRIADAGRDPSTVRILAVTKTFGIEAVEAAYAAGLRAVGENYLVELEGKRPLDDSAMQWHYLGALQTNKIARIGALANVISGVSRAKELDKLAALGVTAQLDIQVDTTGLAQRNGAAPSEVLSLVAHARALGLPVRGLMTVAPPSETGAREAFALVRQLADEAQVAERSMGMSDDYALAAQYGATEVRLGRSLFGPRHYP